MKRLPLLLAMMGMAVLLSAGVAIADTVNCIASRACIGTDGPDRLIGSRGSDYMDAEQESDRLFGNERHDVMYGDTFAAPDNDTSTDGNDLVRGGPGFDELVGYGGDDLLVGGDNADFMFAEESSENKGEDIVRGNLGDDFILARDGVEDTIDCGGGDTDIAFFDKGGIDTVADNCEYKNRYPGFEGFSKTAVSSTPAKVSAKKLDALRAR